MNHYDFVKQNGQTSPFCFSLQWWLWLNKNIFLLDSITYLPAGLWVEQNGQTSPFHFHLAIWFSFLIIFVYYSLRNFLLLVHNFFLWHFQFYQIKSMLADCLKLKFKSSTQAIQWNALSRYWTCLLRCFWPMQFINPIVYVLLLISKK